MFTPSKKNADKKVSPVLTRSEKVKNFKMICTCADRYFKEQGEKSVIPANFISTQMDALVDLHSQKALLALIDLVIVVMLNSERSEQYIESIMDLSEEAQADIQKLIMRSKNNLNDLISQSQPSVSEHVDKESKYASNQRHFPMPDIPDDNSEQINPDLLQETHSQASHNLLIDNDDDLNQMKDLEHLFDP